MGDPIAELAMKSWEIVVGAVIAGVLSIIGFFGSRVIKRVDKVERLLGQTREDYVKKKELTETVNSLRSEIRQQHAQISTQIDKSAESQIRIAAEQSGTLKEQAAQIRDIYKVLLEAHERKAQ